MSQVSEISGNAAQISLHNFSPARRIFALSQVKQVAADLGDQVLVSHINRVISFDHETMHLEALWKNAVEQYHMFIDDEMMMDRVFELQGRELEARQEQGQKHLVEIVSLILVGEVGGGYHDMRARRALLAPIYEHNLRLHLRRTRETMAESMFGEPASGA